MVTNSHPSIPPPLETVSGDESQPPSLVALPRARILMRNRREYTNPQQEVPNILWQEPSPQNPSRYIEGGILRNTSLVHTPQTILQIMRSVWSKPSPEMTKTDQWLSWLILIAGKGITHLVSLPMTLWSLVIMDSLDGFPIEKDYQDILVALLFSPVEDALLTQEEAPWFSRSRYPWPMDP